MLGGGLNGHPSCRPRTPRQRPSQEVVTCHYATAAQLGPVSGVGWGMYWEGEGARYEAGQRRAPLAPRTGPGASPIWRSHSDVLLDAAVVVPGVDVNIVQAAVGDLLSGLHVREWRQRRSATISSPACGCHLGAATGIPPHAHSRAHAAAPAQAQTATRPPPRSACGGTASSPSNALASSSSAGTAAPAPSHPRLQCHRNFSAHGEREAWVLGGWLGPVMASAPCSSSRGYKGPQGAALVAALVAAVAVSATMQQQQLWRTHRRPAKMLTVLQMPPLTPAAAALRRSPTCLPQMSIR